MPPLLSCLLGRRLCEDPLREDHWTFRDKCASLVGDICRKYGSVYATLIPRISRTLLKTLVDGEKPLTCHYGAIVGIIALGRQAIDALLLPHIEAYLNALTPSESTEITADQVRVKKALSDAMSLWLAGCTEPLTDEEGQQKARVEALHAHCQQ